MPKMLLLLRRKNLSAIRYGVLAMRSCYIANCSRFKKKVSTFKYRSKIVLLEKKIFCSHFQISSYVYWKTNIVQFCDENVFDFLNKKCNKKTGQTSMWSEPSGCKIKEDKWSKCRMCPKWEIRKKALYKPLSRYLRLLFCFSLLIYCFV